MNSVILEKGFEFFTLMDVILEPIKSVTTQYNWLITNCECSCYPNNLIEWDQEYAWLPGEELLQIVKSDKIQFIWAVFSAFPKDVPLEVVLQNELPYADCNEGFWQNPVGIQHPLAVIEVVPFDSTFVLFIAKDQSVVETFVSHFPQAVDLEKYNAKIEKMASD